MRFSYTWSFQLRIATRYSDLNVLRVFFFECLVIEKRILDIITKLSSYRIKEISENMTVHHSAVYFLTESLYFFEHFLVHVILVVVWLNLAEHFSELLPMGLKFSVFLDYHVDDVQVSEKRTKVIKNLCVVDFLETFDVRLESGVEKTVHL